MILFEKPQHWLFAMRAPPTILNYPRPTATRTGLAVSNYTTLMSRNHHYAMFCGLPRVPRKTFLNSRRFFSVLSAIFLTHAGVNCEFDVSFVTTT